MTHMKQKHRDLSDQMFSAGVRGNDPLCMRELARILRLVDGNQTLAAQSLAISRRTLVGWGHDYRHVRVMLDGGWMR